MAIWQTASDDAAGESAGAEPWCVLITGTLPDPHFGADNRTLPRHCLPMIIGVAGAPAAQAAARSRSRGSRARPEVAARRAAVRHALAGPRGQRVAAGRVTS